MERETGEILMILGGVAVLTYFGLRARRGRRRGRRATAIERGGPARSEQVRRAFEAEFGLDDIPAAGAAAWAEGDRDPIDALGAVVCPACGTRYIAGTPFCESCGEATVDDDEGPASRHRRRAQGASDESDLSDLSDKSDGADWGGSGVDRWSAPLVCVFETRDAVEAHVVRSLLQSQGLGVTSNGPIALSVYLFHRIEAARSRLFVLEPDADRARRIIASARGMEPE